MHHAAANATSGQHGRETVRPMIATVAARAGVAVALAYLWRATEFAGPDDQCFVQHSPLLKVFQQRGEGQISRRHQSVFQIDEAIPLDANGSEINASDGVRPFIAMEFIEGQTLEDRATVGPMKLEEVVRIASEVAEGFKIAHSKDIVHRDIKSANIMLAGDDRTEIDWGHWTGRGMTWNVQCAYCHMTDFRKQYDQETDTYNSTWTEMGVGCTQCHGEIAAAPDEETGCLIDVAGHAAFSPDQVMDGCATCHSRRGEMDEDFELGDVYEDHFQMALPTLPHLA